MIWKDLHIGISNIVGGALIGVIYALHDSPWWSCGDKGSEVLTLWMYGSIGAIIGSILAVVMRHIGRQEKLQYYTELGLRGLFVYALITPAIIKSYGLFYRNTMITSETKLGDFESSALKNAFFGYSEDFQSAIGYLLLGGLALICFRNSQRVGNILLAGLLAAMVMVDFHFGSCRVMKDSIFLAVPAYFILNDFPSYFSFFSRSSGTKIAKYNPFGNQSHLYLSSTVLKGILLVGLYFFNDAYVQDRVMYPQLNEDNPIAGVWNVQDIQFLQSDVPESKKRDIENFNSIILDKGRWGAVKVKDTMSYFEYIVDPKYNQLEFWNFSDFRSLDLKGKYYQISPDSMVYHGRNNKDSLMITFKLQSD